MIKENSLKFVMGLLIYFFVSITVRMFQVPIPLLTPEEWLIEPLIRIFADPIHVRLLVASMLIGFLAFDVREPCKPDVEEK